MMANTVDNSDIRVATAAVSNSAMFAGMTFLITHVRRTTADASSILIGSNTPGNTSRSFTGKLQFIY
jgi:hypothetical protein